MSESKKSKWNLVAEESMGGWGCPGQQGWQTTARLYARVGGERFRCVVREEWGSNQGYHEVSGSNEAEGRGKTPEDAVEVCREDVFAWALDDKRRAEFATLLRKVCYAAEDAEDDE